MQDSGNTTDPFRCPYLVECKLIQDNFSKLPELTRRLRERYCTRQDVQCARRWLHETIGGHVIPPLMLPDQTAWAKQIVDDYEADPMADSQAVSIS